MKKEEVKLKIEKFGLKKKYIARQIGCSQVELSHFLSGRRDLKPECKARLYIHLPK